MRFSLLVACLLLSDYVVVLGKVSTRFLTLPEVCLTSRKHILLLIAQRRFQFVERFCFAADDGEHRYVVSFALVALDITSFMGSVI